MTQQTNEPFPYTRDEHFTLEEAEEAGVDLSLLRSNLQLTPTERLKRFARILASVKALQAEAARWRAGKRAR